MCSIPSAASWGCGGLLGESRQGTPHPLPSSHSTGGELGLCLIQAHPEPWSKAEPRCVASSRLPTLSGPESMTTGSFYMPFC